MKKILISLYILVVVVMAAATIVENYQGTEFVAQHIYGAWWFSALWALLAASSVFWFVKHRVRRPSVVALHLSFIVILAGALLTHLLAVRGVVPLRKGIPTNQYLTSDMFLHQLPFTISLENFQIEYYEGSNDPSDYISQVTIDGEPVTISMNQIASRSGVRLYQMDFDPDLQGSILTMNYDPWGIPVTYCGYALLFVSLIWMLADPKGQFRSHLSELRQRRFPFHFLFVPLLAIFAFLLYHFLSKYSAANHPLPVLNSSLLPIHVSVIVMAYTLLLVIFVISLVALCWRRSNLSLITYHLSLLLLYPALAFLCYGIFIGAIWANVSWGNYWSWDPKETWALITLMIYAVPAHRPVQQAMLTHHSSLTSYHLYMALAFLTILMTYFGVNFLLGGMHSYA
ncbi:MAG: cytochrome c biogenesis protein CcsA [Prevotella sp.]|nr:cytochrome c biogenesis protein CcsA [Prevotella sp.]